MPEQQQPSNVRLSPWALRLLDTFGMVTRIPAESRDPDDDDDGGDDGPEDLRDAMTRQKALSEWWANQFSLAGKYKERIAIYDEMDKFDLCRGMLDIYVEESTQTDYDRKRTVWIESKNTKIVADCEDYLRNTQAEDTLPGITRALCKYGNRYQRLAYGGGMGVLAWAPTPPGDITRIDDKFARLIGFMSEQGKDSFRGKKHKVSWPWDYIHFRLLGGDDTSGIGTSLLDNVFRPWRQTVMTEDAVLMLQLRRASDRNIVFVDVGDMEEHDAMSWVNVWRKKFRKAEFLDPASAQYRKQYNPMTPLEDIFFPIREGDGSRVEQLSGNGQIGDTMALDYFINKFFSGARIPKAYMGFEGEINAKATLSQQDVRFARTCKRIQRAVARGVRQGADIHLSLLGEAGKPKYDLADKANDYMVQMSAISSLDEADRVELIRMRNEITTGMADLASTLNLDPRVWATYILLNYAKLPEDTVLKLIAKTDVSPTGGGDAAADPQQQESIERERNKLREGFYPLSDKEKIECAKLIHQSPMLRKVIGGFAEAYADEVLPQLDHSILPVQAGGKNLMENLLKDNTEEARILHEHMKEFQPSTTTRALTD